MGAEQKNETKFGKEYIFEGMAKTRIMPPNFFGGIVTSIGFDKSRTLCSSTFALGPIS